MYESEDESRLARRSRLCRIIQALDRSPAVSYILDSGHRIIHSNPAWDSFAVMNGAPRLCGENVVGLNIFDVIPDVLKSFYLGAFARALEEGVWEVSYECSSPDLFRKYRMRVHALKNRSWLLVTNPLIYESAHRNVARADSSLYLQPDGLITMCAHCRCSRRVDLPDQWDFVPDYFQLKGQASLIVSHGFCPICHAYFYA